ncbi:MAG: hypothetical protein GY940_47530 [bacterium]|nr:hypothetical protein [bacterium]
MKINLKKLFTVVTLLVGLSVAGFGVELPSSEVRDAAVKGLDLYFKSGQVSPEQGAKMGLSSAQAAGSVLTGGFQVYKVNEQKLLYSVESFDRTVEAEGTWRFLVVSETQAVSLITVAKMDGKWTTVSIGGAGIAAKLQQILKAWPLDEGYEFRFIRVYNATLDLVEVSRQGDVLGYVSLTTLPGMEELNNHDFNAGMLYNEADFRGPLSDRVEANMQRNEEVTDSSVRSNQQRGLSVPFDHNEQQELSTVSSFTIKFLNVNEEFQEHSMWCWAASSKAILDYYGTAVSSYVPEPQCEIVDWALDAEYDYDYLDSCIFTLTSYNTFSTPLSWNQGQGLYNNDPNHTNHNGKVHEILRHRGLTGTGSNTHLTFNQVVSEIDAGQPFDMVLARIDSNGEQTSSHQVVGFGYSVINNIEFIHYMDPWPSEGYIAYVYDYTVSTPNRYWKKTLTTSL